MAAPLRKTPHTPMSTGKGLAPPVGSCREALKLMLLPLPSASVTVAATAALEMAPVVVTAAGDLTPIS